MSIQRRSSNDCISVGIEKEFFRVIMNVQHFTVDDLMVKISDGSIIIEAKHEEIEDEHGYISRQFVRKYCFPKGYNQHGAICSLSSDGILTVKVPQMKNIDREGRIIPIDLTGIPYLKSSQEYNF